MITHTMNRFRHINEIHLVTLRDHEGRSISRSLYNTCNIMPCNDKTKWARHTDGTPITIGDDEEYRIGIRNEITCHSSWSPPIIAHLSDHGAPFNAKIIAMLRTIDIANKQVETDSDIFEIMQTADYMHIAYDDPLLPRSRLPKTQKKPSDILNITPPTLFTSPPPTQSTRITARALIRSDRDNNPTYTLARKSTADPPLLHRVHLATRSELEYHISYSTRCKKRRVLNTPQPRDINKPIRRRTMTSRWPPSQKNRYNNLTYQYGPDIT